MKLGDKFIVDEYDGHISEIRSIFNTQYISLAFRSTGHPSYFFDIRDAMKEKQYSSFECFNGLLIFTFERSRFVKNILHIEKQNVSW